ncbi:MAG TPA: hypothetical protein EYP69_02180, partial [Bacteroidales bacterium]|nr:hypothetical protein [Bacteroidales bacterium]
MKVRYWLILLNIIIFSVSPLFSQVYKYKLFDQDNQLNNNFINKIIQDNLGNLWIATSEDLSFYNGQKIINYTTDNGLADNFITEAYKDSYGILWFGHQNGNITIFNANKFHILKTGLSSIISGIVEDPLGNIWVSSQNQGILRIRNYEITHFSVPEEMNITTIGFLEDSIILAGTISGLFIWDLDNNLRLTNYREINEFKEFNITSIQYNPDKNHAWITTSDNGIFFLSVNGKSINPVKINIQEDTIENVQDIFEDEKGILWISTFGSGLYKLLPTSDTTTFVIATNYNKTNGLPNNYIKT